MKKAECLNVLCFFHRLFALVFIYCSYKGIFCQSQSTVARHSKWGGLLYNAFRIQTPYRRMVDSLIRELEGNIRGPIEVLSWNFPGGLRKTTR
jgi:hypothetical protein